MRTVKKLAKAASLLLLSLLAGCSNNWTAALQLKLDAGSARQPLTVRLHSSLGDEFTGLLDGDCLEVRIWQSSKLNNRISITVLDAKGQTLGSASTNDLANRAFDIPLAGTGTVTVQPGAKCR